MQGQPVTTIRKRELCQFTATEPNREKLILERLQRLMGCQKQQNVKVGMPTVIDLTETTMGYFPSPNMTKDTQSTEHDPPGPGAEKML
jgi:hypothetical protein